ncbi:phosphate signaling complex protein PhoU [Psychromarinibacter sp. C21-152]|uniref:Phosphate-specific transport system accessory protein PhoU n=1 Tax=Psychromarinibacter sediminicola TaxID=3033385 RepID=A0AAE3NR16_9RHOB|nr:phosphate signaling complex protein PhoU [Psychromarinibacter sediminicola]MDF0600492.1 phosphate signaling complex protein PhoU [Psychromarinibacter sediminicola]
MHDKHISSAFDRDLEALQALIMKMGGLVEASIQQAVRAFLDRDLDLAEQVRTTDRRIDALEHEVNEEAATVIAKRNPMATDLRTVLAVMKIANNLERCGDYTKNLAKRTTALAHMQPVAEAAPAIRRMSRDIEAMLKDALDAFAQRDAELAGQVIERDEDVDQMYNAVFRELLTHMMEDPRNITAGMHLHFIAKNMERMGDHVTSIAEQVVYLVTGEMPEERRPKSDDTSFVEGNEVV